MLVLIVVVGLLITGLVIYWPVAEADEADE